MKKAILAVTMACVAMFFQGCGGSDSGGGQVKIAPQTTLSWHEGLNFGSAIDEISNNVNNSIPAGVTNGTACIGYDLPGSQPSNLTVTYSLSRIDTTSDLYNALGVSAAASVKAGFWSGSAKANYAKQTSTDTYSVYVLVREEIIGPAFTPTNQHFLTVNGINYLNLYKTNYAQFRETCGDDYLTTITTGGSLIGILKITTLSSDEKSSLSATIDAKYAGTFSAAASGTFTDNLTSLTQQSRTDIQMFLATSVNDPNPVLPQNLKQFLTKVASFESDLQTSCFSKADPYNYCAYQASFSRYANINAGGPDVDAFLKDKIAAINKLTFYNLGYAALLGDIDYIAAAPWNFNITQNPSNFDYDTLNATVTAAQQKLQDQADECNTNSSDCTASGLTDPQTIRDTLPTRKNASVADCQDLKAKYQNLATDDNYKFYWGNDITKPFWLYCQNMGSGSPSNFIKLVNTSTPSTSPQYNYGSWAHFASGDMYTVYSQLKVQVNQNPESLTVLKDDNTATWPSGAVQTQGGPISAGATFTYAKYGEAHSCSTSNYAKGNIDLTGTPFAVNGSLTWNWSDHTWHGNGSYAIASNGQVVNFQVEGDCGGIQPAGDLVLDWIGY